MAQRKRKQQVYERWRDVPKTLATRNGWKEKGREVKANEKATAFFEFVEERKLTTIDAMAKTYKRIDLYHENQTAPINVTPLDRAKRLYYRLFVKPANRTKLIRWCKGGHAVDAEGERYWDNSIPEEGWREIKECLTLPRLESHLSGREEYGIFGGENSFHLLIDLDLHNVPFLLFQKRLEVLLGHFHGELRCHIQVAERDARGVHLILFFGKQSPLKTRRRWLFRQLQKLDRKHGDIFLTTESIQAIPEPQRKGLRPVEIYPDPKNGHRLPLATGRLVLLDQPLHFVWRRGKLRQDVVGYLDWLADRNRRYMSTDDVLAFVLERFDLSCASENALGDEVMQGSGGCAARQAVPEGDGLLVGADASAKTTRPKKAKLRGRTRGALVGLWLRSELGPFQHFNAGIYTTLQALHAQGVEENRAIEIVSQYVDELPDTSICSRLPENRKEVDRQICRDVEKVWQREPSYTWEASASQWRKIGFQVGDKTTWNIQRELPPVVLSKVEIAFTDAEEQLLIEKLAPIVLGVKQAKKSEKQEVLFGAISYFLRYVKGCDREIPTNALPAILSDFSLKLRNHDKQSAFFCCLVEMDWLYVAVDYSHPARGGSVHRARRFGIGKAVAYKFGDSAPLSSLLPPPQMELYPVSHFLRGDPRLEEIPSYDDQIKALADDQTVAIPADHDK